MLGLFIVLLSVVSGDPSAAARAVVEEFCSRYVKQGEYGLLEGKNRRALAPLLSRWLLRQVDEFRSCQRDWVRQQPAGSTDKPPFVDCCLFSSVPGRMPTSTRSVRRKRWADGRYRVVIDSFRKTQVDDIRWRDAVIVTKENGRYRIDDVVYDFDAKPPREPFLLSQGVRECRGGRWVEGE